ncbi:alpha/beta fold hydrolase [Cellulosimicrobium sp. NPDC057862]|uniref:alpha/beta fold hydrolase n=1 Tax=Cellulosimicrobium sp. NPDC057862 TaxID=3346266 RepID=UPI003671EA5F
MAEKTTAPREDRSSGVGGWRDDSGREAFESAYRVAMAALPPPERAWDVPTGFGTVRAYRFAPSDGASGAHDRTPALLLPGWGAAVPMWGTNLPALLENRPVYALDALGDAGLSVQTAPLRTPDAQAAWIDQALAGMGADRVHVVGHSFGGWSATNLAVRRPGRVASLSLLDPVQTFSRIR